MQELDLSRCGINDQGAAALLTSLDESGLMDLNLSWNALRDEAARAFRQTMTVNGTLQKINLSHNGLSDQDTAVVLLGLTEHGMPPVYYL